MLTISYHSKGNVIFWGFENESEENLTDVMREIGMTEGFDVGLEMSGSQIALDQMIHNMKHGGNIALLGLQRTDAKRKPSAVKYAGSILYRSLKGFFFVTAPAMMN